MECDESLCRVCLKCDTIVQQSGASIFDKTEDVFIYERLNTICDVNIKPEDGLPEKICLECLLELHNAVRFKNKCENSNNVLLSAVNTNSESTVKKEAVEDSKLEENHYTDHEFLDEGKGELEYEQPHSPPPDHVEHEHGQPHRDEGTDVERSRDLRLKEKLCYNEYEHKHGEGIEDVKLEEDDCTDHEFLNEDEDDEPFPPPSRNMKQDQQELQEFEYIQLEPQPNTERPSRAIDLMLECHDCGGLFKSKCKLKVHWKKEHLKQYLTCDKCKRLFGSFKTLHNHKRKDSEFCSSVEFMFHIEGSGKLSKFFCKQCQYSTSKRYLVKHHVKKHNGEKRFQCDLCSMSFFQLGSLQFHKETHHQIYRREGPCDICGEYIIGLFKFRSHMRRRHNKKTDNVTCDICHKVYKDKKYLIDHMNKHSGKRQPCNMCSKTFTSFANLYSHKRNVHRKKSYEMCPICGYSIAKGTAMKAHIAKHDKYNYNCTVCGHFFETDVQLQLHRQRHDERNHKCSQCNKTFFSRKCLVKHIQVHKN